jgi:hypothetical protein
MQTRQDSLGNDHGTEIMQTRQDSNLFGLFIDYRKR